MKKKNKIIVTIISIIVVIFATTLIYLFINTRDKNALTLNENKWIDSNKYEVVDISLMNDIPVLSYDGNGLIYDYLNYVSNEYSLKFNIITYKLDGVSNYDYKMSIVDEVSSNNLVLLEDNMVLVTNLGTQYKDINDISNLKIGIVESDKELLENYFQGKNIQFVTYATYSELKDSIVQSKANIQVGTPALVDGIIISKTLFSKEIIENEYKVSFHFNDLKKYFVLELNGPSELNSILNKTFNKWGNKNYSEVYNSNLLQDYFDFKNVSDVDQKILKSKSYVYGFIDNGIYNYLDKEKISGLNGLILKDFNKFSGISITYTKYNSLSKLIQDFNSKNVDFMFNISNQTDYAQDVYLTVGVFKKQLVIISEVNNTTVIDGVKSLKNKEVLTIKDSYLEQYLISQGAKVKSYNNMKDLTKDFDENDIAIVDMENYNFYKTSSFKDAKINYIINYDDQYNYAINNTNENRVFESLFDFYISYNSTNKLLSTNYSSIAYENTNVVYILVLIIVVLCIYLVIDFSNHFKLMVKMIKNNKKVHLSKEDKIKYIDQLTSLKNRAYFNSKIESWDDSEVYPQSIIIIDLNNISYINDNYGREEGDKVITEAANILIQHQLQNSEIVRTDGNEFLIYLVGYSEKQIISYLRKLNRELKGLSHGFGAASGYSIITDAIKTVDDAVNEATLDMKNNKEDIDY